MEFRLEIKRRISEIVNWKEVEFHIRDIEYYIEKMKINRENYSGDIRYCLDKIDELFENADDKATSEILGEVNNGLE